MSLTIEPKKGVRLQLGQYSPILTWQGGGKFWDHQFQQTIREGRLAEFLPTALENDGEVFYSLPSGGGEAVSESVALGSGKDIPAAQIAALRAAVAELKGKVDDPRCDPDKRAVLEAFRLPDPVRDYELYRLHGSGGQKKLLVLWGVEKEIGSALVPSEAVEKAEWAESSRSGPGKFLVPFLLLSLALVLAGAWYFWPAKNNGAAVGDTGGAPSPANTARGTSESVPAAVAPGDSPGAAGQPDARIAANGSPRPATPATTSDSRTPAPAEEGGSSPSAPNPTAADDAPTEDRVAASPAAKGVQSPKPINPSPAASGKPSGISSGKPASATDPAAGTSSTPGNTPATQSGASPRPSALPQMAGTPEETASSAVKHPRSPSQADNNPPKEADSPGSASAPRSIPGQPGNPVQLKEAPDPVAAGAPATGRGMTSVSVVSARASSTPKNGRLDILLNAVGNDAYGMVPDAPKVTEWRVDNVVQKGGNGQPAVGVALPVSLTKGTHHVQVTCTTPDGKAITGEADVDVNVKVTEEGSVSVHPVRP